MNGKISDNYLDYLTRLNEPSMNSMKLLLGVMKLIMGNSYQRIEMLKY